MWQFVQPVEQLNSYIMQLPCWFYCPSAKPSTIPMSVPFTKVDLASHFLRMCPLTWQDHFNLHKKGMTPVDMHLLLMSLKAIELVCAQEKSNALSNKKASNKSKKEIKRPRPNLWPESQRKFVSRSIATSARSMGACILCTTRIDCCKYEKDGSEKSQFPCR